MFQEKYNHTTNTDIARLRERMLAGRITSYAAVRNVQDAFRTSAPTEVEAKQALGIKLGLHS